MWTGMILLCVIGGAASIRRIAALAHPLQNAPAQLVALDAAFAQKPVLTLLHIVPALVLVILVPFQFSRRFRNRYLRAHRWIGRLCISLGLVIGLSALGLIRNPIGGALEVSAILVFDAIFLTSLIKAFVHIRRREIVQHREWIIRAMSVALGVSTVRPIMGVFFATGRFTGFTPHEFFGIAFWIGFLLTFLGGELWIRYTRQVGFSSRIPNAT
jgi:uncharacterized membrane protein YozB (DUF420 family)